MANDFNIPTLKEEIEHATVESVLALDVDKYKYGFETDIESDVAPIGLNEDIIRLISAKKDEPEWMLEWRLDAYKRWLTMTEPNWAKVHYPKIDFQSIRYYSAPKGTSGPKSLDEVDPALLEMYEKLGVPLKERELLAGVEQPKVAVDAVIDSVSVVTTFKDELARALKDGFLPAEIASAKSGAMQQRAQQRAQDGVVAGAWTGLLFTNRTFAFSKQFDDKLAALNADDLLAAMRKHLDPARITVVKAGDFAKVAGTAAK